MAMPYTEGPRTVAVQSTTDQLLTRLRDEMQVGSKDEVIRQAIVLLDLARKAEQRHENIAIVSQADGPDKPPQIKNVFLVGR